MPTDRGKRFHKWIRLGTGRFLENDQRLYTRGFRLVGTRWYRTCYAPKWVQIMVGVYKQHSSKI